jgi:azurin
VTMRVLAAALLLSGVFSVPVPVRAGEDQGAAPRLIVLTAGDPVGEKMTYSRATIPAKPGEKIRLRLMSTGKLPAVVMTHNWVLLTLGSDPKKFADAAANAAKTQYIPPALKGQIIAQTAMVGPGETVEITFTVPAKPGSYPYLCTFAGHFAAGMAGTLVVK